MKKELLDTSETIYIQYLERIHKRTMAELIIDAFRIKYNVTITKEGNKFIVEKIEGDEK